MCSLTEAGRQQFTRMAQCRAYENAMGQTGRIHSMKMSVNLNSRMREKKRMRKRRRKYKRTDITNNQHWFSVFFFSYFLLGNKATFSFFPSVAQSRALLRYLAASTDVRLSSGRIVVPFVHLPGHSGRWMVDAKVVRLVAAVR